MTLTTTTSTFVRLSITRDTTIDLLIPRKAIYSKSLAEKAVKLLLRYRRLKTLMCVVQEGRVCVGVFVFTPPDEIRNTWKGLDGTITVFVLEVVSMCTLYSFSIETYKQGVKTLFSQHLIQHMLTLRRIPFKNPCKPVEACVLVPRRGVEGVPGPSRTCFPPKYYMD